MCAKRLGSEAMTRMSGEFLKDVSTAEVVTRGGRSNEEGRVHERVHHDPGVFFVFFVYISFTF